MLKIPNPTPIYTRDLIQEGDIALIEYGDDQEIVYAFRKNKISPLSVVSLNHKLVYWENINHRVFKVLKIFQPGETLEITNA